LRCSFTFGQIEEILATIHNIADDRRVAFEGRLKHLRRWNFPTGSKPGKGKTLSYTVEHLFMMVLALELIQTGMTPKVVVDRITSLWLPLFGTVYPNSQTHTELDESNEAPEWYYWVVQIEALSDLAHSGGESGSLDALHAVPFDLFEPFMVNGSNRGWRQLVINGPALTQKVFQIVTADKQWATVEELRADIKECSGQRFRNAMRKGPDVEEMMELDFNHFSEEAALSWIREGVLEEVDGSLKVTKLGAMMFKMIAGSVLPDGKKWGPRNPPAPE
jgi:hypothetical protein